MIFAADWVLKMKYLGPVANCVRHDRTFVADWVATNDQVKLRTVFTNAELCSTEVVLIGPLRYTLVPVKGASSNEQIMFRPNCIS